MTTAATIIEQQITPVTADPVTISKGQHISQMPADLYIPPDALEVILETFQGPLDLLLYLIRKHNLDILDIPIAEISRQYVQYIELMVVFKLELAAEYLEMAAILAEIKSRMLLPKPIAVDAEQEDPRAALVRKLQEYEQIKVAAEKMSALPRMGQDLFAASAVLPTLNHTKVYQEVELSELLLAFKEVLKRVDLESAHNISREALSVRERMANILAKLTDDKFVNFVDFFVLTEGRLGVVVTFIAILEMTKSMVIELVQAEPFSPIYIRLSHVN